MLGFFFPGLLASNKSVSVGTEWKWCNNFCGWQNPCVLSEAWVKQGGDCLGSALVERGLRCVVELPGDTGSWEKICYGVDPPSRGTADLCCPHDCKDTPGLAVRSSSDLLFTPGNQVASHFFSWSHYSGWLQKDNSKARTARLQVVSVLSRRSLHIYIPVYFQYAGSRGQKQSVWRVGRVMLKPSSQIRVGRGCVMAACAWLRKPSCQDFPVTANRYLPGRHLISRDRRLVLRL